MTLLLLGLAGCSTSAFDCTPEAPCPVLDGDYYVLRPEVPSGRALVFLHGAANDNETVLKKVDEQALLDAGIALVLPESADGRWAVSRGPEAARDDAAFVASVADAVRAEGVASEVALAGHSVGSSMVWFTACFEPDAFGTWLGSSGGFWEPVPTDCEGPVALRHTHGTADTFVPLEGRPLGGGAVQANVFDGMERWAATNHCDPEPVLRSDAGYVCTVYQNCDRPLELCLHDGGHVLKKDFEERALDWMDATM